IILVIIQLPLARIALPPLGIAPPGGSETMIEIAAGAPSSRHLSQRPSTTHRIGSIEHGHEALPLQSGGRLYTGQFRERWIEIDKAHGRLCDRASRRLAGHHHDQRYPGGFLEQRILTPEPVFTEVVSVIAREDDNRIVRQTETL